MQPDNIWYIYKEQAETFDLFKEKFVQPQFINPLIKDDLKEEIRIIEKLLSFSYYEYAFIDVAIVQIIFVLEKALKQKFASENKRATKASLKTLIDWAYGNGYFETYNDGVLHQLRSIRNNKVHDENRSIGGVVFLRKIFDCIGLINDLFEDSKLRMERQEFIKNLAIDFQTNSCNEGVILTYKNEKWIVHKATPVFINNKSTTPILFLSTCRIFDLTPYKQDKHYSVNHNNYNLQNWSFDGAIFKAYNQSDNELITISKIKDETNGKRYDEWISEFNSLKNFLMISYLLEEPLGDYFRKCWLNMQAS
jgi:hypothetical protein